MPHVFLPVPRDRRPRRFLNLGAGLVLFGVSVSLMLSAGLGVDSWDVLHQGIAERIPVSFGGVVVGVSVLVLAAWAPLRQRIGIGTAANAVVVGAVADAALAVIDAPEALVTRSAMLAGGVVLNGLATGLYIGAGLGPGPRDGLMTGLAARTGRSIRSVRTLIELGVLAAGASLGGPIGAGTVMYALGIGPLTQYFLGVFAIASSPSTTSEQCHPRIDGTPGTAAVRPC